MKVSWASPNAARMRSRSRAVSTVPTNGRTLPLSCSHWEANSRSLVSNACWAAGVVGTGSIRGPDDPPVAPRGGALHRAAPLDPSRIEGDDVEAIEEFGGQDGELVGQVVDAGSARAARIDH